MRLFRRSNVLLALLFASSASGCAKSVFVLDALGIDAGLGVADGSVDGSVTNDGGKSDDAGVRADGGSTVDASADGGTVDAGAFVDASADGSTLDAGAIGDASVPLDADTIDGSTSDSGMIGDAGTFDGGPYDSGVIVDAGVPLDSGTIDDASVPLDAGAFDAGAFDAAVDSGLVCDAIGPSPGTVDTSVLGTDGYGIQAYSAAGRAIASMMVGTWLGTRTQSWEPQRHVGITFFPSGAYSAFCFDCCAPFAFGEAAPDMRPAWRVDIADEAQADGELILYYDGSSGSTVEALRHIHFDGTHLTFDLWHLGYFGPVHFDLVRASP